MTSVESKLQTRLDRAYDHVCDALWSERTSAGYWLGELASSALATATSVSAISLVLAAESGSPELSNLVANGIRWLADHQRNDGGWGDTTSSLSNISTTMLVRAAFQLAGETDRYATVLERASSYIERHGGSAAMVARYGKDRTFAVPILANCALAGQANWTDVAWLPFELACLPHELYRFLRLHVVSYALPALIAIGQLIHARRPNRNLIIRLIRHLATGPTLRKLEAIQPESGGFLEAIPLTSFVTMSLAAAGRPGHPVANQGIEFLRTTARPDGSWPIDSNLSVWLTTSAVNALAAGPDRLNRMDRAELERTREWLLAQQLLTIHRYTNAPPGGWGWSHLSGSVPDADDTAGALLALSHLPHSDAGVEAAGRGIGWLRDLQNADGGWPTFCRGWGQLPFDRSGTDLTAHVVRALRAWCRGPSLRLTRPDTACPTHANDDATNQSLIRSRAMRYLKRHQCPDGSWVPLWFGNQSVIGDENPTYGTCKVLCAYAALGHGSSSEASRGVNWLLGAQNPDGGWGGSVRVSSTVEETGLAVEALSALGVEKGCVQVGRGVQWLLDRVESGDWRNASPIGLYFAKLWYFEKLYPLIFTVAALGRARRLWNPPFPPTSV